MSEMSDAIRRQRNRARAAMMVDRRGWSDENWAQDAYRLMNEPDGAITSLVNGHVMALLRIWRACRQEAERGEDA